MSPMPHASSSPALIVIGRSLGGCPRTYRLARPARSRSVAAMCRQLAGALVGQLSTNRRD
jgi:hypothetical protein